MGKGFKHGSGGANPLNFTVVGNPMPVNPKENTLWIDTDVPITGYHFASTKPENMTHGMVWLITGTISDVAFNALKKNSLQVYPISAKQMVNGALVNKTAKSYQGGEWVNWWDGSNLYYAGDEALSVTGGWIQYEVGLSGMYPDTRPLTVTRGNEDITIRIQGGGSPPYIARVFAPKNKIDLTDAKTLRFRAVYTGNEFCALCVWSEIGRYRDDYIVKRLIPTPYSNSSVNTWNIDVSDLKGPYALGFFAYSNGDVTSFKIKKVWLE